MTYAIFLNNKWYVNFGMQKMPHMFTIAHACEKIKITPEMSNSRKPPSNTGDTVSAATWRQQWITLPQVAPTPAPPWRLAAAREVIDNGDGAQ